MSTPLRREQHRQANVFCDPASSRLFMAIFFEATSNFHYRFAPLRRISHKGRRHEWRRVRQEFADTLDVLLIFDTRSR